MSFEVFMQVWCLQKSQLWWKQGKTGEKKPRLSHFRTTLLVVRNFRTTQPLCENAFVPISKKHALGPFSKSLVRISQECEPCANLVRIRFWDKFQNHALCLGTPQECEIFAQHKVSCEICTSSLHSIAATFTIHHRPFLQFSAPSTIKNLPILHSTL